MTTFQMSDEAADAMVQAAHEKAEHFKALSLRKDCQGAANAERRRSFQERASEFNNIVAALNSPDGVIRASEVETYRVVRYFFDDSKSSEVVETGLSLEAAKAHCRVDETHANGVWFDGFEREVIA